MIACFFRDKKNHVQHIECRISLCVLHFINYIILFNSVLEVKYL